MRRSPGLKAVPVTVTLAVGQEAVVNLSLALDANINVTVLDQTPLVNATTAQVSGLVGEQQIRDLPLDGRSFDTRLRSIPAASTTAP